MKAKTSIQNRMGIVWIAVAASAFSTAHASELLFSQFSDNQSTYGPTELWIPDGINSEMADDFEVVGNIDRVFAEGFTWGAVDFQGVYVRFYQYGADGKPGTLQKEYFLTAGLTSIAGSIDVALSPPFPATGKHFLSVQPVINYWYWWSSAAGAPHGQAFYFRNNSTGEAWHHGDNLNLNPNSDATFWLYGTVAGPGTISSLSTNRLARSGFLEIFGSNLGASGTVLIGGAPAPVADWTSTRIAAYVPEASPLGAADVQVVTAGGGSNLEPFFVTTRQPNGRMNWRLRLEGAYSIVRPARGPDGTIYVIDVGFRLYAVSPDGGLKWVVRGAGNKGVAVGADGTIYTASEDTIRAFNPDGTDRWTFVQNPRAFICLGVTVGPDGNIYSVGTQGMGVFSLTPSGALRWTNTELYRRPIVDYGEIVFGPNGSHQQLYFSANDHTRAVRLEDGASVFTIPRTGQPVISPLDGTLHATATAYNPAGQLLWAFTFPFSGLPMSAPDLAFDGTHYTTYRMSELYAINPNGTEQWHVALTNYLGPPNVDPANTLVVVGSGGTLDTPGFFAGISTSARREVWRVALPAEETSVYNPWTGLYGFNQYVDTRAKFSADGSSAYFVAAIATGGLVRDRCFLYSINTISSDPTPTPAELRSPGMTLSAKLLNNGTASVTGVVTVKNQNGAAVSGATVAGSWTLPNGAKQNQTATTGAAGNATFSATSGRGTYTLTATNITKTGYAFDPANSVLSKSITTSSKLSATRAGQNLVLSWPTNVDGFTLQSAPASSANATWSNIPRSPQVNGADFTVTVPMTGGSAIYRLAQP